MSTGARGRPGGWAEHPASEPVALPLDLVQALPSSLCGAPLSLHLVFTDDGLYVPAVVATPPGGGPAPAVVAVHGGSGGLGASFLVGELTTHGLLAERLLAAGYLVCWTEGRRENESAYGTGGPAPLDHDDLAAVFRHVQGLPGVAPDRVACVGVSHGGELELKMATELGGGPAALVAAEPAVIEYLGLRYPGPRTEAGLQYRRPVDDEEVDVAGALGRLGRLPADLPVLVLGREQDHLQGLFRKLVELAGRSGRRFSWESFDHPEHAYQFGPRGHPGDYRPDPVTAATIERIVDFLDATVRDAGAPAGSVPAG